MRKNKEGEGKGKWGTGRQFGRRRGGWHTKKNSHTLEKGVLVKIMSVSKKGSARFGCELYVANLNPVSTENKNGGTGKGTREGNAGREVGREGSKAGRPEGGKSGRRKVGKPENLSKKYGKRRVIRKGGGKFQAHP
jgi:hypothetical protein